MPCFLCRTHTYKYTHTQYQPSWSYVNDVMGTRTYNHTYIHTHTEILLTHVYCDVLNRFWLQCFHVTLDDLLAQFYAKHQLLQKVIPATSVRNILYTCIWILIDNIHTYNHSKMYIRFRNKRVLGVHNPECDAAFGHGSHYSIAL